MLVNGAPSAAPIHDPETDPSAPAGVETVSTSGFASLLLFILASPLSATSAPAREAGENSSATRLPAADGKARSAFVSGSSTGRDNINAVDENERAVQAAETAADHNAPGVFVQTKELAAMDNSSPADVFQTVGVDTPAGKQQARQTVVQAPGRGVTEIHNDVERSQAVGDKEIPRETFAASTTGEKVPWFSGSAEKICDPMGTHSVKSLLDARSAQAKPSSNSAVIENALDDASGAGATIEPKLRFEKGLNGDGAGGDSHFFGSEAKETDPSPEGRAPTQPVNEPINVMPRLILSHEPTAAAVDTAADSWRATVVRLASQIAGHIQLNKREAILHLNPPELGKIKIDLQVNGGKLQAHIFAETREARSLIENHVSELRQMLQANNFDRVDVHIQGGWQGVTGDAMQGFPQQRHQQAAGQQERTSAAGNAAETGTVEPDVSHGAMSDGWRVSMWA